MFLKADYLTLSAICSFSLDRVKDWESPFQLLCGGGNIRALAMGCAHPPLSIFPL